MYVDCDSCPGQHLAPPACPSCVVQLLLSAPPPPGRFPSPPPDVVLAPEARPVEVELVRRTDDLGAELDLAERRAVAVLTAAGLLAGSGVPGGPRRGTGHPRRAARVRTA